MKKNLVRLVIVSVVLSGCANFLRYPDVDTYVTLYPETFPDDSISYYVHTNKIIVDGDTVGNVIFSPVYDYTTDTLPAEEFGKVIYLQERRRQTLARLHLLKCDSFDVVTGRATACELWDTDWAKDYDAIIKHQARIPDWKLRRMKRKQEKAAKFR